MNINQSSKNLSNLSTESKNFNKIQNIDNTNNRILSAWDSKVGWELNKTGNCSREVDVDYTVLNAPDEKTNPKQQFIFYLTDERRYFIANKGNGRVFELVSDPKDNKVIVSADYEAKTNQIFQLISEPDGNSFRLATNLNNEKWFINNCHHHPESYQKITAVTQKPLDDFKNKYKFIDKDKEEIKLPELTESPEKLIDPPELKGLDDLGISPSKAPRATIGSALIPAILVKDKIPLYDSIKESPYYILKYQQYWHKVWTSQLRPGEQNYYKLTTGVSEKTQQDLKNTLDISIGSDWYLRFYKKSLPFNQLICQALNMKRSSLVETDLGLTEEEKDQINTSKYTQRYVIYNLVYEFELTRMDGTKINTWAAYNNNSFLTKNYVQSS
ncbi:hypothetical protein JNUCC74_11540 [Cerasibacillus sp. JNUCC 74]